MFFSDFSSQNMVLEFQRLVVCRSIPLFHSVDCVLEPRLVLTKFSKMFETIKNYIISYHYGFFFKNKKSRKKDVFNVDLEVGLTEPEMATFLKEWDS